MVARALPGGGGSAARARASAACLAAWRAAQGAAPRRPSLRFGRAGGVLSEVGVDPVFASLAAVLSAARRPEALGILTTGAACLLDFTAGTWAGFATPLVVFDFTKALDSFI